MPASQGDARVADVADVKVLVRPFEVRKPDHIQGDSWFLADTEDAALVWSELASIRVLRGREVHVDPIPGVEEDWLRAVILGPVFSLVLLQRGLFPLHSSSVVIDGRAVAISAPSGSGKSTLGAALTQRGNELLADDVTVVRLDAEPPQAVSGFPQIKLSKESLAQLGESHEGLKTVCRREHKHVRPVGDWNGVRSVALDKICCLADGPIEAAQRLGPKDAVFEILRNFHRIDMYFRVDPQGILQQAAKLAESVPVYRVQRPRDLGRLDTLAEFIEGHAGW